MELKDFVSKTLQEIVAGVKEAQENMVEGGEINPAYPMIRGGGKHTYLTGSNGSPLQNVEFDVAVTATEGKGTKGGIGVFVGSVGLGTQGQSESSNTSISRITFSVPVTFPLQSKK